MLVPNTAYPTKMYRIKSNTANSFTVISAVNPRYAAAGSPFAVRLGSMVLSQMATPGGAAKTVKFFTERQFPAELLRIEHRSFERDRHLPGLPYPDKIVQPTGVTGSIQEGPNHPAVIASGQKCTGCHIHTEGFKAMQLLSRQPSGGRRYAGSNRQER